MSQPNATKNTTPLLPREDAREAALFFVVCALCFLAALSALAARTTYSIAEQWTGRVEGELTILVMGADRRAADEALDIITATTGVESARVLTLTERQSLLEEQLGDTDLLPWLPIPQAIAVQTRPGERSIAPDIQRRLSSLDYEIVISEHAAELTDLRRLLRAFRLVAFGAVTLLASTAIAVIAFATHAALLARRDIVEILHLVGAQDSYISTLFERRFWVLGLQAGSVGALAALGVAAGLVLAAQSTDGATWLMPRLQLEVVDILLLLLTPVIAGIASRLATRITVLRALADTV